MDLTYRFTNKEVTPWGGMAFLRQFLDSVRFAEQVRACPGLPQPGSNRGYPLPVLIESFICGVWCGATKFLHTEGIRLDGALAGIFGWGAVPGKDAYRRFFAKFSQADNLRAGDHFYSWIFGNIAFDNLTLDFDSSVLTRYGLRQEGAKRGYNPQKRGRPSHNPLIAFANDVRLVANFWLRSGDAGSSNNFLAFLEDTLRKLRGKKIGLIRLDSGFYGDATMSCLEERGLDYIVAARFTHPIQRLIAGNAAWLPLGDGIEVCETTHQADGWQAPRRLAVVRQRLADRPQAAGKELTLFPEEDPGRRYRYTAYFTNLLLGPAEVWRLYRGRGDAENRIKEIKYDFGFDAFNLKGFYATEAALLFVMLAYNLMSIFRMFVLQEKTQRRLSTLRFRVFAIGAYFQKVGGDLVLMIALQKKRRRWFQDLWNYPLSMPLSPNA